jgi:hypothetical protein
MAAGTGAALGGMLTPAQQPDALTAAGFHRQLPQGNNPNFNLMRGSGQVSAPSFQGYNPYAAVAGPNPGFSFFPQATG